MIAFAQDLQYWEIPESALETCCLKRFSELKDHLDWTLNKSRSDLTLTGQSLQTEARATRTHGPRAYSREIRHLPHRPPPRVRHTDKRCQQRLPNSPPPPRCRIKLSASAGKRRRRWRPTSYVSFTVTANGALPAWVRAQGIHGNTWRSAVGV